MRNSILAPILSLVSGGLVLTAFAERCYADIHAGGDTAGLVMYDLQDLASLVNLPQNAFVTLSNADLGITFGEKLVGQTVSSLGVFDVISGTPSVPLAIDTSIDPIHGVNVIGIGSSVAINGLGILGFPNRDAIGEGALTALYNRDQRVIAFDVLGTTGGRIELQFFSRSGALLGDVVVEGSQNITYVFSSDAEDIAAVTFTNQDFGGLGFDNFRFVPQTIVPEPPACDAHGPYLVQRQGDVTQIALSAELVNALDGGQWSYQWTTECPGGYFDDDTSPTPMLSVDSADVCGLECPLTLTVNDGAQFATCVATVTVEGPATPLVLDVDTTPVLAEDVDCDGEEFVDLPSVTAFDATGLPIEIATDAPDSFPAGQTTTVTYTATDVCGHISVATVDVTVLYGAGVTVQVYQRTVRRLQHGHCRLEPLVDVTVGAYDTSARSCVRREIRRHHGSMPDLLGAVVANCEPSNSARTDEQGEAPIDLMPGSYLLIAQIDSDGDGVVDDYLGRRLGRLRCGQWKTERLVRPVDLHGYRIPDGDQALIDVLGGER
jgi:hypothetical protein